MTQRRKSVVTGGRGFVGYHLVDALMARGDEVTVIDMADSAHRNDVRYIRADICEEEAMRRAVEGADVIFHSASVVHTKQNLVDQVWRVNLGGTETVMRACEKEGVPRIVYVSSASAVYEGNDIRNGDETMPYSRISQAPYADSKIAAEKAVLSANGTKFATCAIRPHVIFGPGDRRFIPNILKRAKQGTLRVAVGREKKKLSDFTYIDNLIDAMLKADAALAPGSKVAGQAYFITNGEPMGFWDFVEIFIEKYGSKPLVGSVPYPIAYGIAAVVEGLDTLRGGTLGQEDGFTRFAIKYMCTDHYFSIAKAKRDFGYEPKIDIRGGIDRTIAHLRATGQA